MNWGLSPRFLTEARASSLHMHFSAWAEQSPGFSSPSIEQEPESEKSYNLRASNEALCVVPLVRSNRTEDWLYEDRMLSGRTGMS